MLFAIAAPVVLEIINAELALAQLHQLCSFIICL